jgi:hypothetical protein
MPEAAEGSVAAVPTEAPEPEPPDPAVVVEMTRPWASQTFETSVLDRKTGPSSLGDAIVPLAIRPSTVARAAGVS